MERKQRETHAYTDHYRQKGYAVIRNFYLKEEVDEIALSIDAVKSEGLRHERSFRHKNLLYLIQQDPQYGKVLRFCQWPAYSSPVLVQYDDLYTHPEPHYIDGAPHPIKSAHE